MLPKELVDKLREGFPSESVQVRHVFRNAETGKQTCLTGIKPQYIIERMNDVWGHETWDFEIIKFELIDSWAYVLGRVTLYAIKNTDENNLLIEPILKTKLCVHEQFGTARVTKEMGPGDALKGAATNSFEKCVSMLDIAHDAYKGNIEPPKEETETKSESSDISKLKSQLNELCIKMEIKKETVPTLIKNVLKKDVPPSQLTLEDYKKIITHLEKTKAPF